MIRVQLTIAVLALVVCGSNVEARGRRMAQQPAYRQTYYIPATQAYSAPAPTSTTVQQSTVSSSSPATPSNGIVQTGDAASTKTVVPANSTTPTTPAAATPAVAAYGSAQWKAEQSARLCSVQHLGGGFGGGSFEGNGFGSTAQQAIQNSCYWGQRTPIEIGVALGANGYYATVFYR